MRSASPTSAEALCTITDHPVRLALAVCSPGNRQQALVTCHDRSVLLSPRLAPGDRVAVVSPASPPRRGAVRRCVAELSGWGLRPEIGAHAFDEQSYLAGSDEDRLADLNAALRDPGVRAVFATRGGKGAYRIADRLDFDALRRDPKPVVGFSDITVLHLAIARHARVAAVHGPMVSWDEDHIGRAAIERLRAALMTANPVVIETDPTEPTAALTTTGRARGLLLGGNQDSIATSAGWALPGLDGTILLLEAFNLRLGHIDRQLTMLRNAGHLDGLVGVAVGQYTQCGPERDEPQGWSYLTILREHLDSLGVPVLGGLTIGHGRDPRSVPLGTTATLDADEGRLHIDAAMR